MWAAAIGTTSLNTLRPSCMKVLSRASGSVSSQRFMKPGVVADVAAENCVTSLVPSTSQRSADRGGVFGLDDDGRADVAKDEVAVAVAPFQVGRRDLRVDHQHTACALPLLHGVDGLLDGKGGRRAGHVHVKAKAPRRPAPAGSRRPWPGRRAACWPRRTARCQCQRRVLPAAAMALLRGVHRNLGHQADLLVGPAAQSAASCGWGPARRSCR